MPELPEVETVARGLRRLIIGKTLVAEQHDTAKSFPNTDADTAQFLLGAQVVAVKRRAKVLLIELSSTYTIMIHLKMTGQLVYVAADKERFGAGHPNESLVAKLPDASTRVTLQFDDMSQLYFNDQRKFGWMKLLPTLQVPQEPFMLRVGPEPLERDFTAEQFRDRFIRRARTSIKAALLDQTVVAGVGNIYADESLWGACIHPATLVSDVRPEQFDALYHELRLVMELAIAKGGSTNKNYVNAEGKRGSYMDFARVFRREGQACPRCGSIIEKTRVAGRGTHFCAHCQVY